MTLRTFLLLLALATSAFAAPPKAIPLDVKGDTTLVVKSFPCTITAAPGAGRYFWTVPSSITYKKNGNVLTVLSAPDGTYKIMVEAVSAKLAADGKTVEFMSDDGETTLTVGKVAPEPGPGPGPNPPPDPTPVPVDGPMRVLIVFESADLPKMKESERDGYLAQLRSPKFQSLLKDRTDKSGPNGRGWNIWEKDQKGVELMDKFWQDAFARPRTSVPFLHVFKGDKAVHEGVLPVKPEDTIAILNKYAGG